MQSILTEPPCQLGQTNQEEELRDQENKLLPKDTGDGNLHLPTWSWGNFRRKARAERVDESLIPSDWAGRNIGYLEFD